MATSTESSDLEQTTLVSEAMKRIATSPDRIRASAEKAWAIAAAIGGVLIATGFTDALQDASSWTIWLGIAAITLWLISAALFIWVSHPPSSTLDAELMVEEEEEEDSGSADGSESGADDEADRALTAAYLNLYEGTLTNLALLSRRLRRAIRAALLALVATGVALALLALERPTDPDEVTGAVLLAPEGQAAVARACPLVRSAVVRNQEGVRVRRRFQTPPPTATVDADAPGEGASVELRFAASACRHEPTSVSVRSDLLLGIATPTE